MAKSSKGELHKPSGKPFPVVGIGASAGGLDAYKRLLKAIPEYSGMAYILVQHLDPTHESMLPDILSKLTAIPVHEVTDNITLAPDHIYITPSNKLLIAKGGVLKLSPRPSKEIKNLPIDLFFKSLAEVYQNHAVGVVLSGTGTDGTFGLKAIKENGGISFAQDQQSAAYDGMPQSAIEAGVVDFVLAPEKIPKFLQDMNLQKYSQQDEPGETDILPPGEEEIFNQILSLLRMRRLVDFTYYKKNTLKRRINRRMAINKISLSSAYLDYLKNNKGELDLLFQDVLIPVTAFFRDTAAFEALGEKVYPIITKGKSNTETLRIWTAGCSTGEEAYSMAISLSEFLGDQAYRTKIQIFATDISKKAISAARHGIYTKTQLEGISDNRVQNFFTKIDGHYQVNKPIRDMVVFASHDMLKDPPFAKMDLISCRNVLIYMENFLQKKVLNTFHYSLKDKGFLLLGKSETIGSLSNLFGPVDKHEKIFSKKDVPGRFTQSGVGRRETNFNETNKSPWTPEKVRPDFQKSADDILLQEYTPAGVVINEQLDIVHFRGDTGSYLAPSPGKPSLNLLKMARGGLGFELRNAIHKAKTGNSPVHKDGVPLRVNGGEKLVTIKVIPLPKSIEPHYLVLFQDTISGMKPETSRPSSPEKDAKYRHIQRLELELAQTREDMRAITEDQEAVNEELQSANEELLSGNEEMQSLNEELETSKEELQSANEELTIVNQELFERNEIINDARKYSESIIGTIREPLLILNKDMQIRTANKSFYKTFLITEQEVEGKLLYDLGDRQWDIPALRTLLQNIIPGKKEVFDFEITHVFPVIGERTMLLNARELQREGNMEKLLLLAIEDITDRAVAEKQLKESEAKFKQIADANIISIAFWNVKGNITDANASFLDMLGYTENELKEGRLNWRKLMLAEDAALHQQNVDLAISGKTILPYETHYIHKDGHHIPVMLGYSMLAGSKENGIAFIQNITQQKEAERKIRESEQRYTKMLLQSPFAFAVLKGKDMVVAIANDAIKTVWGKGKELEGKPLLEILPEIKDQGFPELIAQVYKTGIPYYGHETLTKLKRNGIWEDVYFNFVYQPYREADDSISGITVIAYEVTIQAIANKKIKESGNQLRFMAETIPQKVFTAKPTGEIDYFNPQWSEYTGFSFEDAGDWKWLQFIHADDNEENSKAWRQSMITGEPFMLEHRLRSKDGDYRWHLTRANALHDEKGNLIKWFASSTDIHEAKTHIEEKFLLEFAEDFSSYKTDEEFFVSLVNYIARKSGMDYAFIGELKEIKAESFTIKTIALAYNGDIIPNIENLLLNGPFKNIIRDTVYCHPKDCMRLFPENETITQHKIEGYVGYPLFDQEGKVMGLISVMHKKEIQNYEYVCALLKIIAKRAEFEMERRIFDEKLKESNLRLENSNRNLSQYAYVASHDLQEPLRKIITFSNLMRERSKDPMNEVIESNLEKITRSAQRMKQLIRDLLNYSSLENTGESFVTTDLNETLKNVLKDFELRIEENDAIVRSDELLTIVAVPLQMNQLFSNLLSNSLKFSRQGVPPVINISNKIFSAAELIKHPNLNQSLSYFEIIFKDNGIGFSQKYAEQVFTIFQRLNARSEYPGTGIGLALCKKIVENHQGEIYAEAKENKGAVFHIILPLQQTKISTF